MTEAIRQLAPYRTARRAVFRALPARARDWVTGAIARRAQLAPLREAARHGMVPPQSMWSMVGAPENFTEQGRAFSDYLIEHGKLTPASNVLDIGCGLGKYAIHIAPFLSQGGSYDGFDVERPSIDWCDLAITPRHPNARFVWTPLKSDMYSPAAQARASHFVFPYASERYDLAFLASVFTHMFGPDVDNYIREIARTLKLGGRCIATAYLLNDRTRAGIAAGTAAFSFAIPHDGCFIQTRTPPEAAVAYDEATLLAMFAAAGLTPAEPTRYGVWAERGIQDQDFLILEKA